MKNQITEFDLEAAFKALDEIEVPKAEKGIAANRVNLKETFNRKAKTDLLIEDYYDVNDTEDLEQAKDDRDGEVAKAKLARIEKIVDLDAETADDLLGSYAGKYIIQCPQCMEKFYKDPADIEYSEENPDMVNVNEVCQHCGNTSGYMLIGKVAPVEADEAENFEQADETEAGEDEDALDLDFEEPEEEEESGAGEEAESEEPAEEPAEDEDLDLDLDLEEEPEEEEEKNESLNKAEANAETDKKHMSDNDSENITLNENVTESVNDPVADKEVRSENRSENDSLNECGDKMVECDGAACEEKPVEEAVAVKAVLQEVPDMPIEDSCAADAPVTVMMMADAPCPELGNDECDMPAAEIPADVKVEEPVCVGPECEEPGLKPEEPLEKPVDAETVIAAEVDPIGAEEEKHEEEAAEEDPVEEPEAEEAEDDKKDEELDEATKEKKYRFYTRYTDGQIINCDKTGILPREIHKICNDMAEDDDVEGVYVSEVTADGEKPLDKYTVDKLADRIEDESLTEAAEKKYRFYTRYTDGQIVKCDKTGILPREIHATCKDLADDDDVEGVYVSELTADGEKPLDKYTIDKIADNVENESLTESVDKDLDKKLKEHNAYIEFLQAEIAKQEEAVKNEQNEFIKKSLEARIESLKADLDAAIPAEVKGEEPAAETEINVEEQPVENEEAAAEEEKPVDEGIDPAMINDEIKNESLNKAEANAETDKKHTSENDTENMTLNEAEATDLLNRPELKGKMTPEDTLALIDDMTESDEIDLGDAEDLEECGTEKCITEALTNVYENVESFKLESCDLTNGKLVIEGKINFKSGASRDTKYCFTESKSENGTLTLTGLNEDLDKDGKFMLECAIQDGGKLLMPQSMSYSYHINDNLVEGLAKRN